MKAAITASKAARRNGKGVRVDDDAHGATRSPAQHPLGPVCCHQLCVGRRGRQHRKERAYAGTEVEYRARGSKGQQVHQLPVGRH